MHIYVSAQSPHARGEGPRETDESCPPPPDLGLAEGKTLERAQACRQRTTQRPWHIVCIRAKQGGVGRGAYPSKRHTTLPMPRGAFGHCNRSLGEKLMPQLDATTRSVMHTAKCKPQLDATSVCHILLPQRSVCHELMPRVDVTEKLMPRVDAASVKCNDDHEVDATT